MNIVCFGEALIDFKNTGPLAFQGYAGGSPMNVAVAAARLGGEVGFASQLSTDLFGSYLRGYMEENGVDTSLVLQNAAPSTLAFVAEIAGEAHFEFVANASADTLYDPVPRPEFPAEVALLQFGSISLLKEPAATAITETVARHRDGCLVVFDPNVRPALIDNKERYLASLAGWLALSHIVKVSAQDLRWLYPGVSFAELAKSWLALGPEVVIVTRGEGGVSLVRQGRDELTVRAPQVAVVDTVGAGDTFTGALMVALLEHGHAKDVAGLSDDAWREILAFSAAAAAFNCTRAGAQPPYREELERFLEAGY
ncbi:MAG: carbohydrate kinase [Deinococcota bacterium]|nr:carbohydrate kinase [Deinococcota bacterium]